MNKRELYEGNRAELIAAKGERPPPGKFPHFDSMSEDGLRAFWKNYIACNRNEAYELVGYRVKGYTVAAKLLATYALLLCTAKACRRRGDEMGFNSYIHSVGLITEKLPMYIRERMWEGDIKKPLYPPPPPKPIGHPHNPNK